MATLEARLRKLERATRTVGAPLKLILLKDGDDIEEIAAKEALGSDRVMIVEFVDSVCAQNSTTFAPSAEHRLASGGLGAVETIPTCRSST